MFTVKLKTFHNIKDVHKFQNSALKYLDSFKFYFIYVEH